MTSIGNMVEVGDFVTVDDNEFAEYGINEGDEIYLAGDTVVAVSEDDPYAMRRLFIGTYIDEDDHIDIDKGGFLIDGSRVTRVDEKRQQILDFIKDQDFGEDEDEQENETTH